MCSYDLYIYIYIYKWSITPITNPYPVYSYNLTRDNIVRDQFIIPVTITFACSLLNWEDDIDKRQIVIRIVHSELKFPPEVPLAHVTFVRTVLILPLPGRLTIAVVRYRNISGHVYT
jgi:hypothetical protein